VRGTVIEEAVMEPEDPVRQEEGWDSDKRALRSRLINLTIGWELAALSLDAQRYRSQLPSERESLRENANVYRKCVAELSEVLGISCLARTKEKAVRS
jgi:hypothetical protein